MGRATHDVSAAMPTPHYGRLRVDFSPHQILRCLWWKEAKQKLQDPSTRETPGTKPQPIVIVVATGLDGVWLLELPRAISSIEHCEERSPTAEGSSSAVRRSSLRNGLKGKIGEMKKAEHLLRLRKIISLRAYSFLSDPSLALACLERASITLTKYS